MKKRVFAFLLTIAIVVSACGCQSNQTAETADQLSVFALKNVYVEDINTNEFTKYYEEQSGIHVNWEIASGDASQAFNLKIASGQYPDIFYGFPIGPAEQKLYAKSGILIDLTDYIDKYAPNIKKMFEEKPDWKDSVTIDGKIYGVPAINTSLISQYDNVMWVYKPWFDKLGIDVPTTTDEFYKMLKLVKTTDLNENGQADEIPLASRGLMSDAGLLGYLMNSFCYTNTTAGPGEFVKKENGKIKFVADTDEFKEGLDYIRKLYSEGLIEHDSLTMDRTRITSLGESEPPVLFAAPGLMASYFTVNGSESNRTLDYVAIPPVKGPNGYANTVHKYEGKGDIYMSITSACKDPVTAIKWLDGLLSDEMMYKAKGLETYIRDAKEGEIGLDGKQAKYAYMKTDKTLQEEKNKYWKIFYAGFSIEDMLTSCYYEEEYNGKLSQNRYDAQVMYEPFDKNESVNMLVCDEGDAEEYAQLRVALENCITSYAASFISGEKSLASNWNEYLNALKQNGLERYLEICNKSEYK